MIGKIIKFIAANTLCYFIAVYTGWNLILGLDFELWKAVAAGFVFSFLNLCFRGFVNHEKNKADTQ